MTSSSIDTIWKATGSGITRSAARGIVVGDAAVRVDAPGDARAAARRTRRWETSRTRRSDRAASPGRCRATATARRADRAARRRTRAAAPAAIRCAAAAASAARLFDSISAARSVSASASSPLALRGAHSSGPCGAIVVRPVEHGHRRVALLERGGIEERLERRPGLTAAAPGAVELRLAKVPAADHRQDVAGRRDRSRPAPPADSALPKRRRPFVDRALGRVLQLRARTSSAPPSRADDRRRTDRGTAAAGTPSRSRSAPRSRRDTGGSAAAPARAAFSCAAVMNPSSRIRCSTTWLRRWRRRGSTTATAPTARGSSPAISAASGSVERARRLAEQVAATSSRRRRRRRSGRCD